MVTTLPFNARMRSRAPYGRRHTLVLKPPANSSARPARKMRGWLKRFKEPFHRVARAPTAGGVTPRARKTAAAPFCSPNKNACDGAERR